MKQQVSLLANTQPEVRPEIFWTFDNSWVLTKRSLTHIIRNTDQLLSVFLMPVMFLLLFRYVFGGAINTGETSYVNFLVAGILVQTAAFGANTTTISVLVDLQRGIVDRFRALPMASSALLAAHVIADLARNTISAVIMLVAGFLVGFPPHGGSLRVVLGIRPAAALYARDFLDFGHIGYGGQIVGSRAVGRIHGAHAAHVCQQRLRPH